MRNVNSKMEMNAQVSENSTRVNAFSVLVFIGNIIHVSIRVAGERERMPEAVIKAFATLKKAAAIVNKEYGLDPKVSESIAKAADEVKKI